MSNRLRWAPHRTFGLREEWVALFLSSPTAWQSSSSLGPQQISALEAWLITCGLADSNGMPSALAWRISRGPALLGWELAWVNAVFSFHPSWHYVRLTRDADMTASMFAHQQTAMFPRRSTRTIWDGVLELIGTLERTPIGTELGQGIVSATRPRRVRRVGLADPRAESLGHAMRRLFQHERRWELRLEEDLVWPWVVFGCDAEEALLGLGSAQQHWLQVGADSVRLLTTSWEELDELALF